MFREIDWWTVIMSVMASFITVHILFNKMIAEIIRREEKFMEEMKNVTMEMMKWKMKKE